MHKAFNDQHVPVLLDECLNALKETPIDFFCDMTLGACGHTRAILEAHPEIKRFIGIDQDIHSLEQAKLLMKEEKRGKYVHSNFNRITRIANEADIDQLDVVIADLGVSSMQIDSAQRGFSYMHDAPLDMRMDTTSNALTAKEVVNSYSFEHLKKIFYEFGEERHAPKVAEKIVQIRREKPIETTFDLVAICDEVIPFSRKHTAVKVFQAIRIEVNKELQILNQSLKDAASLLSPNGMLCVITFHGLEDTIVKQLFKELSAIEKDWMGNPVEPPKFKRARKAIKPSNSEVKNNRRARSAKLRILERI